MDFVCEMKFYIYISAVKRLIAINHIQNKSTFYIIYVFILCVYIYVLCMYKYTHTEYILKTFPCICLYSYN